MAFQWPSDRFCDLSALPNFFFTVAACESKKKNTAVAGYMITRVEAKIEKQVQSQPTNALVGLSLRDLDAGLALTPGTPRALRA